MLASAPTVCATRVARPSSQTRASTIVAAARKPADVVKGASIAAVAASLLVSSAANALTYDQLNALTYEQVKGSGVAATCPVVDLDGNDVGKLKDGNYAVEEFCMEPTSFEVRDADPASPNRNWFSSRLVTRLTYTLSQMSGNMTVKGNNVAFKETDGMDFQAVTVKLPSGNRTFQTSRFDDTQPFMFTIKGLDASGTKDGFQGNFEVPSYRGSTFEDPKGRGASTGYDTAVAFPTDAGDTEELMKENIKRVPGKRGEATFRTAKYDAETGEIAGVFESFQPADDDMGSKVAPEMRIRGLWYARLTPK